MVWYGSFMYGMVWWPYVWYGGLMYGMVWWPYVWYGMVALCMVWYGGLILPLSGESSWTHSRLKATIKGHFGRSLDPGIMFSAVQSTCNK